VDKLNFRPARTEDFGTILAINEEGYPGVVRLTLAELTAVLNNASFFYITEMHSWVVGYVIAYTDQDVYDGAEFLWFQRHLANFLYIDQIAIAGSARQAGVGSLFYGFVEQFARQHGLASLVCEVNLEPPNPVSLNFHARNNFVEVGIMETSDGRKVSLRRKDLQ
jgi:hypothetical protein